MRIIGIASAAIVAAMLVAQPARADGVYVTINGQHIGRIQGPAQYGGRLLGLSFNETSASATTSAGHGPSATHAMPSSYAVTFEWGASAAQLQDAIVSNDNLDIKFEFFTQSGGQDQVYYVVTMTNAHAKEVKFDFDASATPAATVLAEFISAQVTSADPSTSGAAKAEPAGTGQPGRALRATPAISLAQGRSLMRAAASDPTVNDAWITVVSPANFHNEVAGPPAKTAELRTFELDFKMPTDPATGQTAGRRLQQPIRVAKAMGVASTDFQNALQHSTVLNRVTLEFGSRAGMRSVYTITLDGVAVSEDQQSMSGGTSREALELRWHQLTSNDMVTHRSATDTWVTGT